MILIPLILFFVSAENFLLRPFWFDESLTLLNFALLPLEKIYFSYVIPNNHIGYTYLLRLWYLVMPQGMPADVWCRLISFAFAGAFIIFSWKKFKGFVFRTALCSFSLSLPFVIYATSVRGYMAALFFSMVTVYYAVKFAEKSTWKNAFSFFLASFCCVSVLPSNLLSLGASVFFAAPVCGKTFYSKKKIYLLSGMAILAFSVFWFPILPQLIRAGELGEGWSNRFASLFAGVVSFAACFFVPLFAAIFSLLLPYKNNKVRYLRAAVFLMLIPLAFAAKAAPFPRVYFPFFGIFLLVISCGAGRTLAWIRLRKICQFKYVKSTFVLLSLGITLLLNFLPEAVDKLSEFNGGVQQDDYFAPWYCRAEHVPHRAAEMLSKHEFSYCYLSFSSDPWSVMFYSALRGVDMGKFSFDGPRGRVEVLPDGAIVVLNRTEPVKELGKRFDGTYTLIAETPMHCIYRYETAR